MSTRDSRNCLVQGGDGVIELCHTGAKWRHEDDRVEDGAGEETMISRFPADLLADAGLDRELCAISLAQLDAGDESALADLVRLRVPCFQIGETGPEVVDFGR